MLIEVLPLVLVDVCLNDVKGVLKTVCSILIRLGSKSKLDQHFMLDTTKRIVWHLVLSALSMGLFRALMV